MANRKINILQFLDAEKDKLFQYLSYRLYDIEDVKDVLQNLYLKALSDPRQFDNVINKRAYIYRLLRNECINYFRKGGKFSPLDSVSWEALSAEALQPEDFEEEFVMINRLLGFLPEEQSEAIRLRLHSDLSFQDIADIMEVPLPTAKARYRYGIEKLRGSLKRLNIL
ncbi:MAG: RNA polymerase sigma factor [Muribaculaceae bacterium]|nr:RNA polymerase sigma factor [Muribaculaceae bacterium]